ncbi:MAG: ribonuclease III [Candidatus Choladocola sp.]|nr:ribonuclease III [Candidatus Choladocola sp.]
MIGFKQKELEEKTGYRFRDPAMLKQAMCHSSYANEHKPETIHDNERLEFLGDAVLEIISSDFLYHQYPDMPEGQLTKLRASIVCEPTLALCAREIGLEKFLLLGKGEEHTGGRKRNSIISDAMEALIGAIYLDGGFANAKEFVEKFVLTDIEHKKLFYDSKTILQEIVQRDYKEEEIRYVITDERGPDHAKEFVVEVRIGNKLAGTGSGSTKKAAEQEAAYRAIIELKGKTSEYVPEKH